MEYNNVFKSSYKNIKAIIKKEEPLSVDDKQQINGSLKVLKKLYLE